MGQIPSRPEKPSKTVYVPVVCKSCSAAWQKSRHSLYDWSGLCKPCATQQRRQSFPTKLVSCRTCGESWLMQARAIPLWHGQCRSCAQPPRDRVTCCDCGKEWTKVRGSIKQWQGRCPSCAQRVAKSQPEVRARTSARAREQVLRQGGIPNGNRFTSEHRGEKHCCWKGGITPEAQRIRNSPEYKAWARAVKERDGFTCQLCGKRGGDLHSDHILSFADYPENRFDLGNGRTLCNSCHAKHHRRKEWTRWKAR